MSRSRLARRIALLTSGLAIVGMGLTAGCAARESGAPAESTPASVDSKAPTAKTPAPLDHPPLVTGPTAGS